MKVATNTVRSIFFAEIVSFDQGRSRVRFMVAFAAVREQTAS